MRTLLVSQTPHDPAAVATAINALASDDDTACLRLLMAFARKAGVLAIKKGMKALRARGGTIHAIIGVDLHGTSREALELLLDAGAECWVFGAKGHTFHPKIVIASSQDGMRMTALVGSANLTGGGCKNNFEAATQVSAVLGESAQDNAWIRDLNALWKSYREPKPPLSGGNLIPLDEKTLLDLVHILGTEGAKEPDQQDQDAGVFPFPKPAGRALRRPPTRPGGELPTKLYLEVTGPETGQGREIQVPRDSLPEFFGIEPGEPLLLTFLHAGGVIEQDRPVKSYANSTHRISSGRFRERPKGPVIVELARLHVRRPEILQVRVVAKGATGWRALETRLTRGGGSGKRWGIA